MAVFAGHIEQGDLTFEKFLSLAVDFDRAFLDFASSDFVFLAEDELYRLLPICCGMANGDGGWIVLGARESGREEMPVSLFFEGVLDVELLERRLRFTLRDPREISVDPVSSFHALPVEGGGKKLLSLRVESVDWRKRPVCVGENNCLRGTYRRVEGVDVVSGQAACFRMALDALELLRDDLPVPGLVLGDLDAESVASFRKRVLERQPLWKSLSDVELLKRALVLDDSGTATRAGQLLLEENGAPVRVKGMPGVEDRTARNLWSACSDLLPRLCENLTKPCAEAVRECFVNALLHAEYDAGGVVIECRFENETIAFSHPGLPRTRVSGECAARNYRLLRIFVLVGLARGEGQGLGIVRNFADGNGGKFSLKCDALELRTVAELSWNFANGGDAATDAEEGSMPECPEPRDLELDGGASAASVAEIGWMPVLEKEQGRSLDVTSQETLLIPDLLKVPEYGKVIVTALESQKAVCTEEDDDAKHSLLVQEVRDTPRPSPEIVRDAILELCVEYRSLPELAARLSRTEGSLRRHYITAMAREGLLEMEHPERVGHPDQRYRKRS